MRTKIAKLITVYCIFQSVLIVAFYLIFKLPRHSFYSFFLFNFLWHLVIYFYLASHTEAFYKIETTEDLEEINLANTISLFRASAVMPIGYLIWFSEKRTILICAIIYAVIIFLSDALDGFIARRLHETTHIGKMIDSMCDYALLIFISGLFYEMKILPLWFFLLLFIRLFIQAYGMVKFLALGFPMNPKSTIGGKITIASTMFLYFLALISLLFHNSIFDKIVQYFLFACAILIFIFIFEKIILFVGHWKQYKEEKTKKGSGSEKGKDISRGN
ncbi:MAG: CDP-alcohol phosphatidyltransferase family protein [Spirochaetaceae bacterium]|nr:CDP-alcohol phosphatidyltransferase family protein [Spirochaetaceae bacterium]